MNVPKKSILIIISSVLIVCIISGIIGHNIGKRATNQEIINTKETIAGLTDSITELESTIKTTADENTRLRELHQSDTNTIGELEGINQELAKANSEITAILDRQRKIIIQLTEESKEIGRSSDNITTGLGEAIETVNGIIREIQER